MKFKIIILSLSFAFFSFSASAYATPEIKVNYKLNGKEESVRLNPLVASSKIKIEINTNDNEIVEFSGIDICHIDDLVCDKNTRVRHYFTTTEISSVVREWDGKTSGTINATAVEDGDYKIKVTMVGVEKPQDLSPYIITIDSNYLGGSGGSSSAVSQSYSSQAQSSIPSSSPTSSSGASYFVSANSSSSAGLISAVKYSNTFEVNAGSDRLVYTDTPTDFTATVGVPKGFSEQAVKYVWSFGDGSSAEGKKVSHSYKFAGDYIVVLNGSLSDTTAVSRANMKVISPSVFISNTTSDSVEITNQGAYEINLKGWSVSNSLNKFAFSSDTIIGPNKKIAVPDEYMKLNLSGGGRVFLLNPSGKEAGLTSVIAGGVAPSASLTNASSDSNFDNDPAVKKIRDFIANGGKASSGNGSPVSNSKNNLSAQAGKASSVGGKSSEKNKEASAFENGGIFSSSTQASVAAPSQPPRRGFIRNFLNLPFSGFNLIKRMFYSEN